MPVPLAMSGNKVIIHPSATLGPIDPQINGIPARSIKHGCKNAKKHIQEEGPESLPAYFPFIEKYSLHMLEICDDSEKLAKELVADWLQKYMFKDDSDKAEIIESAVRFLSDYDDHKIHSRPFMYDKLNTLQLKIELSEDPLTGFLWEAYILLVGFFGKTDFVKLYENSRNISWGRQHKMIGPIPIIQPPPRTPPQQSIPIQSNS